MIRWLAAAIIVIVHRWKIVVDKGICMDHLNGASDWKRGITVAASGLACRNDSADAFACRLPLKNTTWTGEGFQELSSLAEKIC